MNTQTLSAAVTGLVLGGALADAVEGIFDIATGMAGIGAAIGVLYGVLRDRRQRANREPLAWGAERRPDWHTTGLVGGAIGAIVGLALGIVDALLGG